MSCTHNTELIRILDIQPSSTEMPLKSLAQARSIERPSKVSKSTSRNGLKNELYQSITFHQHSIPVLISAPLLRQRGLGQVDLARLYRDQSGQLLEVAEVKSSLAGVQSTLKGQKLRIFGAARFVGSILNSRIKITNIVG